MRLARFSYFPKTNDSASGGSLPTHAVLLVLRAVPMAGPPSGARVAACGRACGEDAGVLDLYLV